MHLMETQRSEIKNKSTGDFQRYASQWQTRVFSKSLFISLVAYISKKILPILKYELPE